MQLESIYHRPRNEYAYFDAQGKVELLLRTGRGDIVQATLIWFDKYCVAESIQHTPMALSLADDTFGYYRTAVQPPRRRLQYYFLLTDAGGTQCFLDEQGLHSKDTECVEHCFQMAYLNRSDALCVPQWAQDAVFYQIFPDSFARSAEADTADLPPWNSPPHITKHLGGDFRGIAEHLDYLCTLGVNALYLCPIFQSNSCHRYNTYDYMKIDPRLGTLEDFEALLARCHAKGLRVVLDAVFNHSCDTFPRFADIVENGETSPWRDWYFIKQFPVQVNETDCYERFAFEPHMPKLNTENPETRAYLLEVARYWTAKGIDGWRLDVANEVDLDFWRTFRREVKALNPEALILGEIWGDAQPYLGGDLFDSVMNYPIAQACQSFFLQGTLSAPQFVRVINQRLMCYPLPIAYAMYNLLGSHDTPRWLTLAGGDWRRVALSAAFLFFCVGMPAIYYGDETGMEGGDFIQARQCMQFTPQSEAGEKLLALYRKLAHLRTEKDVLRRGAISWLELAQTGPQAPLALLRTGNEEKAVLIFNHTQTPVVLCAEDTQTICSGAQDSLVLAPMSFRAFFNDEEVTIL